jgi:Rod binding domain-containing protein
MSSIPIGGGLAAQAQSGLLQSREDHMINQLDSLKGSNDNAKIDKSAQEFESMLLGSWLQQAQQSMATVPGADDDSDDSGGLRDQMMSIGTQALSKAMAADGGIGIAKMIAQALHKAADRKQAAEGQSHVAVTGGSPAATGAGQTVK